MARKDFHNNGFDNGTLIKLHVFKEYLKAWLPVFLKVKNPFWQKIFIYDFFAGEGKDGEGNSGSPLIIIDELKNFCKDIKNKDMQLKVILNEYDRKKKEKLQDCSLDYINKCRKSNDAEIYCPNFNQDSGCVFQLNIENNDFKEFFQGIYSTMIRYPKYPRLMFLDQFGIKQINSDIFGKLISLERTDFIFFISSFHAMRFVEMPEFKKYLDISKSDFDDTKSYQCHRVIFDYYKSLVPKDNEFYLAPFSIKKGANIYGLIFGTHHKLGIEKFLKICWKINPNTGDANFDIDNEKINPREPKLFAQFEIPSKLDLFSKTLEEKILSSDLVTNSDIYTFTFDMGCLPQHANIVVNELVRNKKIQPIKTASSNIHRLIDEQIVIIKNK
jgi:three-Cys-motif partner protein